MPSAPPSWASVAAQTGSGSLVRRACAHRGHVIDVDAEFDHGERLVGKRSCIESAARKVRSIKGVSRNSRRSLTVG